VTNVQSMSGFYEESKPRRRQLLDMPRGTTQSEFHEALKRLVDRIDESGWIDDLDPAVGAARSLLSRIPSHGPTDSCKA
jgi:hypothetical protein